MLLRRAVVGAVGLAREDVAVVPPGEGVGLHMAPAVVGAAITTPGGVGGMGQLRLLVGGMGRQLGGLMVLRVAIGVEGGVAVTAACHREATGMEVKQDIR